MSDGEVDIRLLALRRQQRRNRGKSSALESLDNNTSDVERLSSGHSAYETTPVKTYAVTESPIKNGGTHRRNSYLGNLSASLFDEDSRLGRMHMPPVIRCECNGVEGYALISTSETVSTITMDFARKLRVLDQIIPDMSQSFNPLAVNQPEMKGKVKYIDLTIGSWQQVAQFNIVESSIADITLGIDFLRRTQSVVNFGDSVLLVGGAKGERIPFLTSREVMSLAKRHSNKPAFIIGNGFLE
ncbi:unnamed protein product [Larinioides sclopetarius]